MHKCCNVIIMGIRLGCLCQYTIIWKIRENKLQVGGHQEAWYELDTRLLILIKALKSIMRSSLRLRHTVAILTYIYTGVI